MKKNLILIFILICSISFISAENIPLQVTLSNNTINALSGVDYTLQATFYNPNTISIEKVELISDIATMNDFSLLSGESKSVDIIINTDTAEAINLEFRGWINIEYINPTTHEIDISPSGLSDSNIDIIVGDSISWNNLYTTDISLYDDNGEHNILAGDNFLREFTIPETTSYFLFPDLFTGYVYISNNTISHLSALDNTQLLNINIDYEPTTLVISYITNTAFTIPFTEIANANIIIKNTGSKKAYGITMSGDWLLFGASFNLEAGTEKNVEFVISPQISSYVDTNKTYTKQINISGNFNTISQNIDIYIPYANINGEEQTSIEYLEYLHNVYCANNSATKNSILCTQVTIVEYKYINNLSDQEFTHNMSIELQAKIWKSIFEQKDILATSTNILKEQSTAQDNKLSNITSKLEEISINNNKNTNNLSSIFFGSLTIFGILMVVGTGTGGYYLLKKYKNILEKENFRRW